MPKTHIDDGLYARAGKAAQKAGYSGIDELIKTAIENEIRRIGEEDAESRVADQLRGLGYIEGSSPEFVGIGRLFPGGSTPRPRGIYRMEANPGEREKRERDDEGRPVSGLGPWNGARVASQQSPILRPGHEPL